MSLEFQSSMKLFFLYTAVALCTAQPRQSRPRTIEEVAWRLRKKNEESGLGETKFMLGGFEGEDSDGSPSRQVAAGDLKAVVVGLLHDHPDWTNRQVAAECIKIYPNYSITQMMKKVGIVRRSEALRTSRGLVSGQRSQHAWTGLNESEKRELDRRVIDLVKIEVEKVGGGRYANSVPVMSNVQKKFFEETGRYIPQSRLDMAFSHVRLLHE